MKTQKIICFLIYHLITFLTLYSHPQKFNKNSNPSNIFLENKINYLSNHKSIPSVNNNFFIENKGQWPKDVFFLCRLNGIDYWITKYGINFTYYKYEKDINQNHIDKISEIVNDKVCNKTIHRVLLKYLNTNNNIVPKGIHKLNGYYNYLIGNDISKHQTRVGLYKEVILENIFEGIDIKYYFENGFIRFDYIVHPFADTRKIQFQIIGADSVYLDNNTLTFQTIFGKTKLSDLQALQENEKILSSFKLDKNICSILLGKYNLNKPLIIDPIIFSTLIGGTGSDYGADIITDNTGCIYVCGKTGSSDYDITPGVFQPTQGLGSWDAYVTKLAPNGNSLIYSTFIGGNQSDMAYKIKLDVSNNVYICGESESPNFPTYNGYQNTNDGFYDAFALKLNSTGTSLLYSTLIGGNGDDTALSMDLDSNNEVILVGKTKSNNYDITSGVFQSNITNTNEDIFLTRLNSAGNSLIFSTYIGGSGIDFPTDVEIDHLGNYNITGYTNSTDLDIVTGCFQTSFSGGILYDGFVMKMNQNGTSLIFSTYIGGTNDDRCASITSDNFGNVYVIGTTQSSNFDITPNAIQPSLVTSPDIFLTKLNPTGTNLLYSSYFGGNNYDYSTDLFLDNNDNNIIYFSGITYSSNYPTTSNAISSVINGSLDIVFTKLNINTNQIIYSTYLGGNNSDNPANIFVDNSNNIYITGITNSTNYPVTSGVFQNTYSGGSGYDVIVTKICLLNFNLISSNTSTNQSICLNSNISNIVYITSDVSNVSVSGLPPGISYSYLNDTLKIFGNATNSGIYTYTINFTNSCSSLSSIGTISVSSSPANNISLISSLGSDNQTVCLNTPITNLSYSIIGATGALVSNLPSGITYSLSSGILNIYGTPTVSGSYVYSVSLTGGCGYAAASGTLNVQPLNTISPLSSTNQTVCMNNSINPIQYVFNGATSATVTNLPNGTLFNVTSNSVTIYGNPTIPGIFTYTVHLIGGCGNAFATGFINVINNHSTYAVSNLSTINQTVCSGSSISPITYSTTSNNNLSVVGLPIGILTTTFSNGVSISGTPTITGTYIYTVLTNEQCVYSNPIGTLIVVDLDTSITKTDTSLISNQINVNYQWINCFNQQPISGANQQEYIPSLIGYYSVILSNAICTRTSSCIYIDPFIPIVSYSYSHVSCKDNNDGEISFNIKTRHNVYQLVNTYWTPNVCDGICYSLNNLPPNTYSIDLKFNNSQLSKDSVFRYYITIQNSSEECSLMANNIIIMNSSLNNYLHIKNIDNYPINKVYIFNRWGNKIKTIENYDNNQNRWPEKNSKISSGTYFYIIETDKIRYKGFIEVFE